MFNLILFGPPGAGKGTQSAKLIDKYQLVHISTGDLFRAHIQQETELGKKVKALLASGELVSDAITIAMLEEEIGNHPAARGFIFDGFPRTVAQAEALDKFLEGRGDKIGTVIALDVDEDELRKRIAERHKVSNRPDDAAEKLVKRIDEYFGKTIHVLPFYEGQGKLRHVNGIGEIDAIFSELCQVIDEHLK
ncbi:adenylate kinase [Taibaiella koreensis]|uniref:adenylate kinase n=1 Tax=Taibaiella koreensis TaxID=1268548 RepID=UPI000E59D906|nr:adenylate kinase [Taibaiella koreensis]